MMKNKVTNTYDLKTRRRAVKSLSTGVGHRTLALELGIPEATARQWSRSYAVGGSDALMNAGATHKVYSYDLKLAVVQDRLEHGMSVREVMVKHGVPSESSVKTWCRLYRKEGSGALVTKPRGRKRRDDAGQGVGLRDVDLGMPTITDFPPDDLPPAEFPSAE